MIELRSHRRDLAQRCKQHYWQWNLRAARLFQGGQGFLIALEEHAGESFPKRCLALFRRALQDLF